MKLFVLAVATWLAVTAGSANAAGFSTGAFEAAIPAEFPSLTNLDLTVDSLAAEPVLLKTYAPGPASRLPAPSTWAMMIMGFGAAGAMMRRRQDEVTYRLEECAPYGGLLTEEFAAPDDEAALNRAASVVSGDFKLWRGDVQIGGESAVGAGRISL